MEIIYGYTHPHESEVPCIHCDWTSYYDDVKEQALIELDNWNDENPDDKFMPKDWEYFLDEAIEAVAHQEDTPTTCSKCI